MLGDLRGLASSGINYSRGTIIFELYMPHLFMSLFFLGHSDFCYFEKTEAYFTKPKDNIYA